MLKSPLTSILNEDPSRGDQIKRQMPWKKFIFRRFRIRENMWWTRYRIVLKMQWFKLTRSMEKICNLKGVWLFPARLLVGRMPWLKLSVKPHLFQKCNQSSLQTTFYQGKIWFFQMKMLTLWTVERLKFFQLSRGLFW